MCADCWLCGRVCDASFGLMVSLGGRTRIWRIRTTRLHVFVCVFVYLYMVYFLEWCICYMGTRARVRERIRRIYDCVRTMIRLLKTCAHVCAYILTRVHKHARTRTHTQTHTTILILSICFHIHMTGYWAAGRGQDGGGVLDVQREGGCQNCRDDGTRGCRKNQNLCRRHGKIDR